MEHPQNHPLSSNEVASLINLGQYPILNLGDAASRALIMQCRGCFRDTGVLVLPHFVTPAASSLLAAEARNLDWAVHQYHVDHTVYFEPIDNSVCETHPRRRLVRTDKGSVPYDLIPSSALLRRLYEWDPLLMFVAAVLDEPRLYRHGDPMAALNINAHGEGQQLGWHFDRTDFAVTLSLQQSESGGTFEYVPNLRSARDENYEGIAEVLAGDRDAVRQLSSEPGTLTLFRGHFSLHRVSPGSGPSKRLMAALSYVREPGVVFSPYARKLFYGREAPVEQPSASSAPGPL